ncbi:hypothetical protein PFISCL1PPCAC_7751 [Pristionchus fissidentatus]|uniref:Uncharacterized protein n=1 Tax=Pristionchus fissidentatus TaxID=1538716 RepID=A0AAV5VDC5_9BILA|nr:hypothetical protein PFISCL1PPCAC_7751 [Pristionchus fissidentatus]
MRSLAPIGFRYLEDRESLGRSQKRFEERNGHLDGAAVPVVLHFLQSVDVGRRQSVLDGTVDNHLFVVRAGLVLVSIGLSHDIRATSDRASRRLYGYRSPVVPAFLQIQLGGERIGHTPHASPHLVSFLLSHTRRRSLPSLAEACEDELVVRQTTGGNELGPSDLHVNPLLEQVTSISKVVEVVAIKFRHYSTD